MKVFITSFGIEEKNIKRMFKIHKKSKILGIFVQRRFFFKTKKIQKNSQSQSYSPIMATVHPQPRLLTTKTKVKREKIEIVIKIN